MMTFSILLSVSYFNYGMNLHSWQRKAGTLKTLDLRTSRNNVKADSRNSHPSFKANGGGVFLSQMLVILEFLE